MMMFRSYERKTLTRTAREEEHVISQERSRRKCLKRQVDLPGNVDAFHNIEINEIIQYRWVVTMKWNRVASHDHTSS